ncbi:hypothetical protein COL32_12120 [Bacillus pseudomycoides]|uniref:Uncharacterized protein n=1 Tax=Bacillus pseudomycoides TaxID=64104 RepID=A0ABD6T9C6_9BACI|nr:hypothetical protein [Bacillus pseudomycoides]PFX44593.1 hypothetical protein COL32_12120 [Bacillus pseudomycoides]PHE99957.1 hypothetical protein COF81_09575 [Bacillus pseudomycoides]
MKNQSNYQLITCDCGQKLVDGYLGDGKLNFFNGTKIIKETPINHYEEFWDEELQLHVPFHYGGTITKVECSHCKQITSFNHEEY